MYMYVNIIFKLSRAILFEEKMGNKYQQQLEVWVAFRNVFITLIHQKDWVERLGSRWRIEKYLISNTTRLYRDDYEEIGALF